jgi:xylose isomerase
MKTPRPWHKHSVDGYRYYILGTGNAPYVCTMDEGDQEANASFIETAYDLLELVEQAFERFTDNDMQPPNQKLRDWLDRASKVLAKAEDK